MTSIKGMGAAAFRDYVTDGEPSSGVHQVVKASVRTLMGAVDALANLSVLSATETAQPGSPSAGDAYIIPADATGDDWAEMSEGSVALYEGGAWIEIEPREGWQASSQDDGALLVFLSGAWTPLLEALGFSPFAESLKDAADAAAFHAGAEGWHVLAASAVAVSHTGNTNETVLATVPIPAGAMGPNGVLRVTTLWAYTNSGNAKVLRYRLGGIGGPALFAASHTTTAAYSNQRMIANRNSASSQVLFGGGAAYQSTAAAVLTRSVNTALAQDLVFTAQLANAGETITLESYIIEVFHQD